MLAGNAGRWTPVVAEGRVDAILKDDAAATPAIYSDPPFNGPVATLCALVLNGQGDAVGIVTQRRNRNEGAGGRRGMMRQAQGIPVVTPVAAFAQYLVGEAKKRGVIGVTVEALAPKVAEAMGIEGKRGVIVTQVTPGSGAAAAGLEAQDILTSVGGMAVGDPAGLQKALRGKAPGTEIEIVLLRMSDAGPVEKTVKVKLTAREEADKSQRFHAKRFGFRAEPLTADVRRAQQLPAELEGVHVRRVTPGSPAAMGRPSALRRGDVILRVGQVPIPDMKALQEALKAVPNGTPVSLFVRNGKDTRFVEIKPE
jgi:S1-C subfamily serine protease